MGSLRVWLFPGLVAIAAALMLTSFIMPWWTADFGGGHGVYIYGHGLRHSLESLAGAVSGDVTPFYQNVLAWVYMAVSVSLIFFSTRLRGRKGRWLLGGVGLTYIVYAVIAVIWIAVRTGDFGPGIPLQGYTIINTPGVFEEVTINIYTSLQPAYYIAHAAGLMCVGLALFHKRITGAHGPNY